MRVIVIIGRAASPGLDAPSAKPPGARLEAGAASHGALLDRADGEDRRLRRVEDRQRTRSTPNMPRLEIVNVPPSRSASCSFPSRARPTRSARATAISATVSASQPGIHRHQQPPLGRDGDPDVRRRMELDRVVVGVQRVHLAVAQSLKGGDVDHRYKVRLTLQWKDVRKEVLVTLNDRTSMDYPLLIGRNFLSGDFLVDVDQDSEQPPASGGG